jgi:MoaA/NifB/PqqE/SkfB family radical SAM enzyme
MWMNNDSDRSLSLSEKKNVIRQFSDLNRNGRVVFCGGELMLKKEEFFELTLLCNKLDLLNLAVTNGALIDAPDCERILSVEPDILVFSLDSHKPEIHDWIRGQKGAFDRAVGSIKLLVNLRKEVYGKKTRIYLSQVLMEKNIKDMDVFIDFSRNLGVDGVRFQGLLPTFSNYNKQGKDSFFKSNFFNDEELAIRNIKNVKERYVSSDFVLNNRSDFEWMEDSVLLNGKDTSSPQCGAFYKNIYIDQEGNYSLCPNAHLFTSKFHYPGKIEYSADKVKNLGNFREMSLEEFWYGDMARDARCIMGSCKKICGITPELRK